MLLKCETVGDVKKSIFLCNAEPLKAIIFLWWNKLRFVKKVYFNIHAVVTVQLKYRRFLVPPKTVSFLLSLHFILLYCLEKCQKFTKKKHEHNNNLCYIFYKRNVNYIKEKTEKKLIDFVKNIVRQTF